VDDSAWSTEFESVAIVPNHRNVLVLPYQAKTQALQGFDNSPFGRIGGKLGH